MEDEIQTNIIMFLYEKAKQYVCVCKKHSMKVTISTVFIGLAYIENAVNRRKSKLLIRRKS
jgi:hypothetical protein